ncbi:PfkB family carbohydrate kinase [Amycolatopsis anabasis]|uniref:PfkB family carbohydrate kinase n=1 Tax=Amycolatopsis anabasis TaxID=1840409 RepID=UPI001FEA4C6E|nr:PfkB family carbohydrate kinase [Amycolatopsis anabasis]
MWLQLVHLDLLDPLIAREVLAEHVLVGSTTRSARSVAEATGAELDRSAGLPDTRLGYCFVVSADVVVVGQVARDLVLTVADAPGAGESAPVRSRREVLGGKGANQAVGLAQLGVSPALVGVVGEDRTGEWLCDQAVADEVDVTHVVRRRGAETALIVDVVDASGRWRYLEHVPGEMLVTERDVFAASSPITAADSVIVQLQQPSAAAVEAARLARAAGTQVVLDGAPGKGWHGELLACADIVRADAREAEQWAGGRIRGVRESVTAGVDLLARGPELVVLEVAGQGNVFVSRAGYEFLPLLDTEVVDTTGSGDALVAALTAALLSGEHLRGAARVAVAAAAATASHPGGRPNLAHRL